MFYIKYQDGSFLSCAKNKYKKSHTPRYLVIFSSIEIAKEAMMDYLEEGEIIPLNDPEVKAKEPKTTKEELDTLREYQSLLNTLQANKLQIANDYYYEVIKKAAAYAKKRPHVIQSFLEEEANACRINNSYYISIIKFYRALTGSGLKEAKAAVDKVV